MIRSSRGYPLVCAPLIVSANLFACSSPEGTSSGDTTTASGGAAGQSGSAGRAGSGGAGGADPCKTALYCDDFEAYNPGGDPGGAWSVSTYMGSVAVDTTHAHSGGRAVKITADASGGYRSALI